MADDFSPLLTVELIRQSTSRPQDSISMDPPSAITAKRRKSKIFAPKTNEQVIRQANEEFNRYVEWVIPYLKGVITKHDGQLLQAFRDHVRHVRDQMETLRKQSSSNATSEQIYLQRIETLQKQLVVFREESLKLFQKVTDRDQQIADLNAKLEQAQKDNAHCRKSLELAARRNKELQAALLKQQSKEAEPIISSRRQPESSQLRRALFSPISKELVGESIEKRPLTSAYGCSKTMSLRIQSNQKIHHPTDLQQLRNKLESQGGSNKLVSVDTVMQLFTDPQTATELHSAPRQCRPREKLYQKVGKRRASSFRDDPILQAKSGELAERTDYLEIFKKCVTDIKKDIMRRSNIPSLNFFKENGPKDFIEFKKVEHHLLLELFLRDERVLNKFYELIFKGE